MSIYQIGRLGKVYLASEGATYGVAPVFAASDAVRHLTIKTSANLQRADSLEKRGTPGLRDRFSRHIKASVDLDGYLQPSGTTGVAPEAHALLRNAFGVEVAGGAIGGFSAGQMVAATILAGPFAGTYARIVVDDAGTLAPALPAAADSVTALTTYQLANELPDSLTVGHYLPNLSVEEHGWVVDKLSLMFDGNDEAKFKASGPARERARPAQAQPDAFTTVGSPVTGIVGAFLFNGTAYQIVKMSVDIDNSEAVMNDIFGTDRSQGYYRNGRRKVSGTIDAYVSDDVSVITQAELASDNTIFAQCGNVDGRVVGLYMPRVEFDVPDTPDGDGALKWSFKFTAKETLSGIGGSAVAGNDELILGL